MNLAYLLPPLIASIISATLLVLVIIRGRISTAWRPLSLLILCTMLWGLFIFLMRSSSDAEHALGWDRIVVPIGFAICLFNYQFSLSLTKAKSGNRMLILSYFALLLIFALSQTDLFIKNMKVVNYGYAPIVGPGITIVYGFGYLLSILAIYYLFKGYQACSTYEEKNRFLFILLAMCFPLIGGIFEVLPTIYPTAIFGSIFFCLFATIAIVKYHLLDIRIIVRKGLTYLLVSIVIAIPYVGILYLLHFIFKPILEPWWVHPIIILLLAIVLQPLYSWAQNFVDRLFYRDRYDYLKALEEFSQKAQSVVNFKELSSTLTQLVSGALHASSACLLLPSESDNGLIVVSSTGLSPPSGVVLGNSSLLIKWLKLHQRILSSEEFNIVPQLQSLSLREKNNLKQMEAELYVPIQTGVGQLSGILVLGQKLSQQLYSSEDRRLLTALSSQMAIALENARLYNESQQEVRERKQAEKALRESEEFSSSLLTNSPNPMLVINQDTSVRYVNPALYRLTGFSSKEVIGRKAPYPWWTEETLKKTTKDLKEAMRQGAVRLEELFQKKNGERLCVEITSTPVTSDGEFKYYLVNWVDITERKRAEEREKELQRELYLSSRLAAIGELAAGVAHEINNPLTGIVGFSGRLLRKSTDQEVRQDLETMSRDLGIIHNEAERATKVVQNLLTFARRRQPNKQHSDINEILQSALELRAYELKTSNIEVITDLAPSLPRIMIDFHQIQEVFLNIILNAEQVMTEAHSGGKLTIKTEERKGHIRTMFTDDGPGIPVEHLDKIFDPFFSTKGARGGTGLGLSVCHGIINEHGGRIYAKSKPGKGATFFVELPIIAEE